jgi:uncharacterized membrane protein
LALIVLWAVIVMLAAVPGTALDWARQSLNWVQQNLGLLGTLSPSWLGPLLRVATIVLATVIVLILLWREVRRGGTPAVKLQLPSGGEASVTAESVARRLAWHLDQLADVRSVEPHVKTRGRSVDIALDLETSPDVEVPMKTEEVMVMTRQIVQEQLGLQLGKVEVNIRHTAFPETI